MLYDGFAAKLAQRFQRRFDEMEAEYNFENGDEFEIALCKVFADFLPQRARICRGYVVERGGAKFGDDLIVFDAARFPTLRALGGDLSVKERVPAEAVLAYIEAKFTLYVGEPGAKHKGQGLEKALRQVDAVKSAARAPVPLSVAGPRSGNNGMTFSPPAGYPNIWNPWYCGIFAKNLECTAPARNAMSASLAAVRHSVGQLPDVIAAGHTLVLPAVMGSTGHASAVPFLCGDAQLIFADVTYPSIGIGALHLLWALEWIELGSIPWGDVMLSSLKQHASAPFVAGTDPIR